MFLESKLNNNIWKLLIEENLRPSGAVFKGSVPSTILMAGYNEKYGTDFLMKFII